MYTIYASASNNTPFYTDISSYIVWRVHHWGFLYGRKLENGESKLIQLERAAWNLCNVFPS